MQSYVFFIFYIDEINPQCKGDLSCDKPSSQTIFIRRVQSYSCEWLKHTSENGGTPPTVALVRISCHISCHILSPLKIGFSSSAHRLINITLLTLVKYTVFPRGVADLYP